MFLNRSSEKTGCVGTVTVQDGVCYTWMCQRSVQRPHLLGLRGDSERSLEEAARKIYGNHLVRQKEICVQVPVTKLPGDRANKSPGLWMLLCKRPKNLQTLPCYLETAQSLCASCKPNVPVPCFIKYMGRDSMRDPEARGEQRTQP